jgi:hypothetical protein
MRTIIATAALLVALSAPSFAETTGTDARGSDQGSFRLSQKDPNIESGQLSMAQGKVLVRSHRTSKGRR